MPLLCVSPVRRQLVKLEVAANVLQVAPRSVAFDFCLRFSRRHKVSLLDYPGTRYASFNLASCDLTGRS
jgi:hypothetical protein